MLKPAPGTKPLAPVSPDTARDPLAPRLQATISIWISVVPPKPRKIPAGAKAARWSRHALPDDGSDALQDVFRPA